MVHPLLLQLGMQPGVAAAVAGYPIFQVALARLAPHKRSCLARVPPGLPASMAADLPAGVLPAGAPPNLQLTNLAAGLDEEQLIAVMCAQLAFMQHQQWAEQQRMERWEQLLRQMHQLAAQQQQLAAQQQQLAEQQQEQLAERQQQLAEQEQQLAEQQRRVQQELLQLVQPGVAAGGGVAQQPGAAAGQAPAQQHNVAA